MRGDFDDARSHVDRAKTVFEELGQTLAAGGTCGQVRGTIEILADRLDEAEQALRESCETCERLNESAWLASRAAELADILYCQSRHDEAEEWVSVSRERAGREDRDAQSSWRCVQARIAARHGDFVLAENLAQQAVQIAEQTDALNHHAKMLLALAEVARLDGREAEALNAARRAITFYELKGNVVAADRARSLLSASAVV
jgi:ATP/maltotriose-dependent transcriptional regulator MalT